MEKITAFKLSDGRIIEDQNKARELQQEIDIKNKLLSLLKNVISDDGEKWDTVETMYANKKSFIAALNGF